MVALLKKELLENARWWPLGLLLIASLVLTANGNSIGWNSFVAMLVNCIAIGSSVIALSLGLLHSLPDQRASARAYLLHRGVSASQVFWSKTIMGALGFSVCVFLPLLVEAIWLELRGPEQAPTRWIQAIPPAIVALAAWSFFPASVMVACRPVRWLGSRLLPFIAVGFCVAVLAKAIVDIFEPVYLSITVACGLSLIVIVLLAARHSEIAAANLPPASSSRSHNWSVTLVMFVGCCVLGILAIACISSLIESITRPAYDGTSPQVVATDQQELWLLKVRFEWSEQLGQSTMIPVSGCRLSPDSKPDINLALPADLKQAEAILIFPHSLPRDYDDLSQVNAGAMGKFSASYDRRGYLFLYQRGYTVPGNYPLQLVISRDGIHLPYEP